MKKRVCECEREREREEEKEGLDQGEMDQGEITGIGRWEEASV